MSNRTSNEPVLQSTTISNQVPASSPACTICRDVVGCGVVAVVANASHYLFIGQDAIGHEAKFLLWREFGIDFVSLNKILVMVLFEVK
jgi:hypothetical protein